MIERRTIRPPLDEREALAIERRYGYPVARVVGDEFRIIDVAGDEAAARELAEAEACNGGVVVVYKAARAFEAQVKGRDADDERIDRDEA